MKLGIVGGMLQGMEAVYLAKKAGYETVVIDHNQKAPAMYLADTCCVVDIVKNPDESAKIFSDCDAVLPANENLNTLMHLNKIMDNLEIDFLFDLNAYNISSSKVLSNDLMKRCSIPIPEPWPSCGFPAVVKPSSQSGSVGVRKVFNKEQLNNAAEEIQKLGDEIVIQEFAEGPNISVEVIGDGVRAEPMILTEIVLDEKYDCKMVRCPVPEIDKDTADNFCSCGRILAEELGLKGIMDVEAIVSDRGLKVLEIDARIPSQTPAAIVNATGVNLLEQLINGVNGKLSASAPSEGSAIYEHLAYDDGVLRSCGEKVFAEVCCPRIETGLFGSSEMITDYDSNKKNWRATVICCGKTPAEAWEKRQTCLEQIIEENSVKKYMDPVPEMITLPA